MRRAAPGGVRRRVLVTGAAVLALVAAGIAAAGHDPAGSSLVSATFYANTAGPSYTHTCTGANNDSFTVTDAVFTGTSTSSDANLNGSLTIRVHSIYDTTKSIGSLTADLRINATSPPPGPPNKGTFHGRMTAVDVANNVQGFVTGDETGGGQLLGNVVVTFTSSGFGSQGSPGSIGSGTGATPTAIVESGDCKQGPPQGNPPQDQETPDNPHLHPPHPGQGPKPHHD
jgi:hypothetical protein